MKSLVQFYIRALLVTLIVAVILYCGYLVITDLYVKEKPPESRIVTVQDGPELQRVTKQALGLK